jgi:hypothetical protein
MKFEQPIQREGKKQNTMTSPKKSRRGITVLMVLNSLFWALFWAIFFWHSSSEMRPAAWEQDSFYLVLGRGFGNVATGAFRSWFIESALLLHIPCVLITWPLGPLFGDIYVAGTNLAGLRLILITLLSYGQWYVVAKVVGRVRGKWRNNPTPTPVRA